ncbi:hypothetical protein HZF02_32330 (plasmid) [Pseudomonas yamanorum]|nr:hypothetical protein HZF02_32330 [Pseudomonas yamanorum]
MSSGFRIIPFTQNGSSILPPRNFMLVGQYLESPSKQYKLILEADANLVFYNNGVKIWVADSATPYVYVDNRPNSDLVNCFYMQGSAFLVDHVHSRTWATSGNWKDGAADRAYFQVQDDGNVVIIDGVPTWARFGFTPIAVPRPRKIYDTGTERDWRPKDFNIWSF